MSTWPRLEARVGALERRQINLDAQIEELSGETAANFNEIGKFLDKHRSQLDKIETTMATKDDIAAIRAEMATKEDLAAMATKEDLVAMEARMLDMFKQILTVINTQRPAS